MRQQVAVIANPASGVNRSALDEIRSFLEENKASLDATLHLTEGDGDAQRFAREAGASGINVVASYGGDGTQMEVASGLLGLGIPMLMLPGGTANVMAIDLGIPTTLEAALGLLLDETRVVRPVDMGCIDNEYFLLRAGIGYEAEMSANTDRGDKQKGGRWAYLQNALRKLRGLRQTKYILTIDGETHVRYGVTCMICNSSSIGIPNLRFVYNGDVSDGLLDVIIIPNMKPGTILKTALNILSSLTPTEEPGSVHLDHFQAREVTVQMKDRQFVARDGEPMKRSKRVSAYIIPHAINVIVPAPSLSTVAAETSTPTDTADEHLDRDQTPAG